MSIAVTRTKIHVPRRRADLLSRPRLNTALVDLLDYPFTLISAPAGYGKTCLMIDLAHQASHPVCWYSIGPLDKEPKRFLAHFIHAIRVAYPDFGKPSLDLLDNLNDPLSSQDQFISTLVNDIYNSISENFAIFLDDFHLLGDHSQLDGFISCFGQQMDENAHLVLSSRKLFNFPDLPLLLGRKLVKGIDQNDLAFQPHELQKYFQEKLQQPLSEEDSIDMIKNTAGWITGLLLSKETNNSLFPDQTTATRISSADLSSYFSSQVFETQPEPIRKLMLQTSLFDEFDIEFCKNVLGKPDHISYPEFLSALTDDNLFVELVEDKGIWVRYHHLFRDFLRQELEKRLPEEKQQILNRLVEAQLASEDWEKAFAAAYQLGDPQKMAEVINTSFSPLFHAGRIKLLADWLEILPEEGYFEFPKLFLIKGISYTSLGNPEKGLELLSDALNKEIIKKNQSEYYRGLLCRATTNRLLGNYENSLNDLEVILLRPPVSIINDRILAEAQRETALCKYHLGNYIDSINLFTSSLESYKIEDDINNSALVHSDLGFVFMTHGELSLAKHHFQQAQVIWTRLENFSQLSILLNNQATLSTLLGDYKTSKELLAKAESYSIETHNSRIQSFVIGSKGDLALSLSNFEIAYSCYEKAEEIANSVHEIFLSSFLPICRASCMRCLNNPARSREILTKHQETFIQARPQSDQALWILEWGFTHLAQHNFNIAQDSFQKTLKVFSESHRPFEQAKSLLGLALIAHKRGKEGTLEETLGELDKILAGLETMQPLMPEFSCHLESIHQFGSNLPEQEYLQDCINEIILYLRDLPKTRESIFPQAPAVPEAPGLEIKAFGEISIRRNGKHITASEWIHQKTVREIFFYLLSHPRGVTREQLGLTFWPDSSPSKLSCQFKNAMYRLRRAIGKDTIHFHQETRSYSFNRECRYVYDVENFQETLNLANSQLDEDCRMEHLRHAVSIYKHSFVSQLDGTWAEPQRRKLYLNFEEAMLDIADYELKKENYTTCRDACLEVLEIEPCQERAYELCMEAYFSLGEIMNVIRTYNDCKFNLSRMYSLEPSKAINSLYERLVNPH